VSAGVPIRQVQAWLGHSTITMTMRYSHLAPGGGTELIGVLDGAAVGVKVPAHGTNVAPPGCKNGKVS